MEKFEFGLELVGIPRFSTNNIECVLQRYSMALMDWLSTSGFFVPSVAFLLSVLIGDECRSPIDQCCSAKESVLAQKGPVTPISLMTGIIEVSGIFHLLDPILNLFFLDLTELQTTPHSLFPSLWKILGRFGGPCSWQLTRTPAAAPHFESLPADQTTLPAGNTKKSEASSSPLGN